ncbi:MAG: hypothetical protein AAF170_18095 [Bacteroidota bacterium]
MNAGTPRMLTNATVSVETYLNRGTQAYRTHITARAESSGTVDSGRSTFAISMSYDGRGEKAEVEREAVRIWNQRFG